MVRRVDASRELKRHEHQILAKAQTPVGQWIMKWDAEIFDDAGKQIDCVDGDVSQEGDFAMLFHRAYDRMQQHRSGQSGFTEEGQASFTIRFRPRN